QHRDVYWQDTSGTVAFLHDIPPQGLSVINSAYVVQPEDYTIICGGATTYSLTLPSPADYPNRTIIIAMQMAIASSADVELSDEIQYLDRSDGAGLLTLDKLPASSY